MKLEFQKQKEIENCKYVLDQNYPKRIFYFNWPKNLQEKKRKTSKTQIIINRRPVLHKNAKPAKLDIVKEAEIITHVYKV